jgi:hypothetical protein
MQLQPRTIPSIILFKADSTVNYFKSKTLKYNHKFKQTTVKVIRQQHELKEDYIY